MCSAVAVLSFSQCKRSAENEPLPPGAVAIKDSVIADGLNYPWEILWGPDNFIWVTERSGRISRLNPSTGTVTPIHTVTETVSNGEGGMLGMALHPNFSSTPHVFVAYNYNAGGYKEKIVRFTYNGTTLTNPVTIIDNISAASIHNGCRLVITPDLKLFITTGDAANQSLPQNNSAVNGKVLRLNLDGSIPADNPIAGNPMWSLGHRNAQGLVFANNKLYASEHGPDSDDEINIIEKGRNYGWPTVKGFCNESGEQAFCAGNNIKEPLKAWTPTVAACGMDYYNNNLIPQWKNSLLMVSLKNARLYQMKLDDSFNNITGTNEYFNNAHGRLRDVCISPEGKVYLCTSNGGNDDKIIEIKKQ
ncbi:MAG: PQQ-dependent sugar dehydrogenase [Chitinophagaceae bacterium]|nr:PQQ-dependent sugar dehydrogenase [Chitinophagaceae bacterium]